MNVYLRKIYIFFVKQTFSVSKYMFQITYIFFTFSFIFFCKKKFFSKTFFFCKFHNYFCKIYCKLPLEFSFSCWAIIFLSSLTRYLESAFIAHCTRKLSIKGTPKSWIHLQNIQKSKKLGIFILGYLNNFPESL